MTTIQVAAAKAALYTTLVALYASDAEILVRYGPRGASTRDVMVCVTDVKSEYMVATIAPSRPLDEAAEITVIISAGTPGADTQQAATERAYGVLQLLVDYLQTSPNETLGLGPRARARVISAELREDPDRALLATGHNAALTVIVSVQTRI